MKDTKEFTVSFQTGAPHSEEEEEPVLKLRVGALAWGLFLAHRPAHPKVGDRIPGQGTYLGCGFHPVPRIGQSREANHSLVLSHIDVFLSLSPFSSKVNKHIYF